MSYSQQAVPGAGFLVNNPDGSMQSTVEHSKTKTPSADSGASSAIVADLDLTPQGEPSDQDLLERIGRSDSDALMRLYQRHCSRAFSLAYRILGERTAAEEILQDAFVRVWQRPEQYRLERGQFASWLLTVVRNQALDRKRKENRRAGYYVQPGSEDHSDSGSSHLLSAVAPAEELESAHSLREVIETLPEAQRQVIELAYFEGLTHSELADRLGESVGTVKTRIRLGLSKMREAFRSRNWTMI